MGRHAHSMSYSVHQALELIRVKGDACAAAMLTEESTEVL